MPVSAPGKGATPVGKLWVSAVSKGWRVRSASVMAEGLARSRIMREVNQSIIEES